ncbi:MAG: phytanoyl-CoA dioxygenase family protein [Alphaproteobacteria bacterium]|nr:phytanoyl-CoA dioxygenase family protein [Alphaproteobacteria bacterium]MBU0831028.1 phytanoyl-CoA dioxygenase family protein [Alphaproteobacteria bacterium]MBU1768766.1 phytanoyl-CoA dioxygenase family protein [Alphaproteobacteria bacterium]
MASIAPCNISGATTASEDLQRHGFCVLQDIEPQARIAEIDRALDPRFASTPFCQGGFYGPRTKRFGGLLKRVPAVENLVRNAAVMRLVRSVLDPWCDTIQLNLTQALELHPGAPAQLPHRDQDMWRGPAGELEYLVNVMWPVSPFKAENGATLIWPGSHNLGTAGDDGNPIALEADPGSAILFLGSTLHGAGSNHTSAVRRGIIISYCLGWLKPYENQWLTYPPDVASAFDPELAALVGYQQHRPNLGNYDGQCPSILLRGEPLEYLAATDALRPDQEGALAEFLRHQQRADQIPPAGGIVESEAQRNKER